MPVRISANLLQVPSLSAPLMLHGGKTHPRMLHGGKTHPRMLHGGKTHPRIFRRPTVALLSAAKAVSLKENVLAPIEIEDERPKIGSSMWAPNVQEMVEKFPLLVPEKYKRSPEEMENDKIMPHLSSHIPIIDFALLKNGNTDELSKLDYACRNWGFFQIWSNGIYQSTEHRVVTNGSKLRMSHVFGLLPSKSKNVSVEPLNHLISSEKPKKYHKVKVGDYANIYINRKLDGRAQINEAASLVVTLLVMLVVVVVVCLYSDLLV
ncbi:hypothetical protein RIF29_30505 [Crotalaria pallida]|uniref:Non-haem dioxygenase N-terminal domain-containing protein n=1 Tax=Crotalaria pallida TaxID=3830 RepID=A0AAN9EG95_CROPI